MKTLIFMLLLPLLTFASAQNIRIVGGQKVTDKGSPEYKHTVRLYIRGTLGKNDNFDEYNGIQISWRCTATLVAPQVIVTASHCFPNYMTLNKPDSVEQEVLPVDVDDISAFFGTQAGSDGSMSHKVIKYIRHEGFNDNWFHELSELWNPREEINDVAVGLLNKAAPYDKEAIQLLNDPSQLTFDTNLVLAGYGKSYLELRPTLRKVSVPFKEYLENGSDYFAGAGNIETPNEVSDPQGACFGDSGGPAYLPTSDGYLLAGIIVRGPDEGAGGCKASMTIMTSIPVYYDWIIDSINELRKEMP